MVIPTTAAAALVRGGPADGAKGAGVENVVIFVIKVVFGGKGVELIAEVVVKVI